MASGNAKPKPSKYRNVPTVVDGTRFDSKKEAERYLALKAELAAGRISGLRLQVRFPIRINGVVVCRYVADFVYVRNRQRVVEDVKGHITAVYKLKKRLMQAAHGIAIEEV
jgi:hypothetical protein